ncbi:hypothetical protein [Fibrella aquatilis]|uniref:PI-PLC Y-box domain-containing protein n=1 Tax=Fibrella aquatilis TaxID=2817059 RepID=A0A939G5G6_9BACT|nr:hypothetical protein [Fibrella aquatilis]MBO0930381.1 hypothetical protein [Fibrella aquatilis]
MHLATKLVTASLFVSMLVGCTINTVDPTKTTSGSTTGGGTAKQDCELKGYGWIDASNTSKNPYDLWLNGVYVMRLSGNTLTKNIQISQGPSKIYVKQVTGYLLYPTEVTWSPTINSCKSMAISFP